ncbi:YkgJ family cysteine cluster protein [Chitiniphilus purpureus]|uniref:YkgJ family cysteine cluster protein n=1 Tax=Chitiniphilus purpureus TaxID=2981137 RepID=A0ABY6DJP8_9NEIS|nr:YkgJ family cysteine cluster protein [Chitiniphilus sp. CD1]UXY13661.1 YkgJ family cysteine cluster protein [Chitiniphilus sp. CD1]
MLSEQEQAAFLQATQAVQQAVHRQLQARRDGDAPVRFVINLQRGVDRVCDEAGASGAQPACRAGCSHCCHRRVAALEPEVFRIAQALAEAPQALPGWIAVLRWHAAAATAIPEGRYWLACPFLRQGLCAIYDLRPAVCRKGHSLDAAACAAPDGDTVPQRLDLIARAEAMINGTALGYRAAGLSAGSLPLGPAVLLALTDPTAQSRWLQGEAVFSGLPRG